MNCFKFVTLPTKEKKKIVNSVVRAANKDQKELAEEYDKLREDK